MNRITWHHTGGGYTPSAEDLRAYHACIDGDGQVVLGHHPIRANAGRLRPGRYAAHTRGLNTGNIGIALCCMGDGVWRDPDASRLFPRPAQIDALLRQSAAWCREYRIPVDRRHTLSHAEVEPTLGVEQRGKWDFDYDPRGGRRPSRNPVSIGDELRRELQGMMRGVSVMPPTVARPVLRQGARGDHVRDLQARLGITVDGIFGPGTAMAVRDFQRTNDELMIDGVVGPVTWETLE